MKIIGWLFLFYVILTGCSHHDSDDDSPVIPRPSLLVGNSGDAKVSLGWVPNTNATAASYDVTISPPASGTNTLLQSANSALITGLANNTTYSVSVRAVQNGQRSEPSTLTLHPSPVESTNYTPLSIAMDPSLSGVFDPSPLHGDGQTRWLVYSGVDYYTFSSLLVQDVSTRIARSDNGGASFFYTDTLGVATSATVTDTGATLGCPANQCNGRWVYEVPWLIDDANDPDANRRYKVFAHKYFLYPPATPATQYQLGAIVMWTAPSLDNNSWSQETVVLGWDSTPPELSAPININQLTSELNDCIVASEGAATVDGDTTYFVFACPYFDASVGSIVQKTVMLKTDDHLQSVQFVGTPVTYQDAVDVSIDHYSAPGLIPVVDSAPVLFATRVVSGLYAGCDVFTFSDISTGVLHRSQNRLQPLLNLPQLNGNFGGACAYDRGWTETGILLNSVDLTLAKPFQILQSKKSL